MDVIRVKILKLRSRYRGTVGQCAAWWVGLGWRNGVSGRVRCGDGGMYRFKWIVLGCQSNRSHKFAVPWQVRGAQIALASLCRFVPVKSFARMTVSWQLRGVGGMMCVGAGLGGIGCGRVGPGSGNNFGMYSVLRSHACPCSRQVGHHSHEGGISFQVEVVRVPVKSFAQVSWQYKVLSSVLRSHACLCSRQVGHHSHARDTQRKAIKESSKGKLRGKQKRKAQREAKRNAKKET